MIEETDKGVTKVKHPPKEAVIEWTIAQEKIEEMSMAIKKSFSVAGIVIGSEEDLILYIKKSRKCLMFFCIGSMELSEESNEDLSADCSNTSESNTFHVNKKTFLQVVSK